MGFRCIIVVVVRVGSGSSYCSIEQQRLADVLDLGNGTAEVESFREHDFEDLKSNPNVSPLMSLDERTVPPSNWQIMRFEDRCALTFCTLML